VDLPGGFLIVDMAEFIGALEGTLIGKALDKVVWPAN
jgi:hypothetical protein